MLNYDQREALEEVEYAGMDVVSTMYDLTRSQDMRALRGNLLLLITEAKCLVEMAEKLYYMTCVTEEKE